MVSKPGADPRRTDAWRLLTAVTGVAVLVLSAGPFVDPDVFWHILAGRYPLEGQSFPHPDPWSFSLPEATWHSTAWLSEVVLAGVTEVAGLAGVMALRFLMVVAVAVALARLVHRYVAGPAAALVYVLALLPLTGYLQERPQTLSLLFVAWLAVVVTSVLRDGVLPRARVVLPLTYLWALFHGLFVLVPALLVLAAVGRLLDHGRSARPEARHLGLLALGALGVAALTPTGPRLLLAPLTVGRAAREVISEWQPTSLAVASTWGFALLLIVVVLAWARSTTPAPRSEVLLVLALGVFGCLAYRNTGPASVLLLPVAALRLAELVPATSSLSVPRWVVPLVAAMGLLAGAAEYVRSPLLAPTTPTAIAAQLARQPAPLRVLNDYNLSGYLLYAALPAVQLSVDGRADRYGADFLHRFDNAARGGEGWQDLVVELDPQVAVLRSDEPLAQLLVADLAWRTLRTEHGWSLLASPGQPALR